MYEGVQNPIKDALPGGFRQTWRGDSVRRNPSEISPRRYKFPPAVAE